MIGQVFKLKEDRFRLDTGKKFFTMRVMTHWHRLFREAVCASFPQELKARMDGGPEQPGAVGGVSANCRELGTGGNFKAPSNPSHSIIL